MVPFVLISVSLAGGAAGLLFALESFREKERRAPWAGLSTAMLFFLAGMLSWGFPALRWGIFFIYGLGILFLAVLFIPASSRSKAPAGTARCRVGAIHRFDERDIVFARNRSLPPGSDPYRLYYSKYPERESRDALRRSKGGPVGSIGLIDKGFRPNVAMIEACFKMPVIFGPHAVKPRDGKRGPENLDPVHAAARIKGFAVHLGAGLAGICRVNPEWAYSHRGEIFFDNWKDWGKPISEPLPFAVVIAVEMDRELVGAAPHTPTLLESAKNYAKGAYITTILARWFSGMGFSAAAQHSRHYDLNLVPLAIDAGLGELGRMGFLITDRFGPRVRLFAVTTDMPLAPDAPADLGVDGFCRHCLKCAGACPSRAIPAGEKEIVNGIEKWRIDPERCFDFWAKVGTDCSICMGICPFSRPHRGFHRLARRMIRHSRVVRATFPALDNGIYGKRWHPRGVPAWVDSRDQTLRSG